MKEGTPFPEIIAMAWKIFSFLTTMFKEFSGVMEHNFFSSQNALLTENEIVE
jgi:hypothetical protein